jgi:thiamine-phosphate diphosphorylase/hydroxyethylthiazole kinase
VETATKLHDITKQYNVPLIINDRVDVAIASGAEGVHLGQDDMCKHFICEIPKEERH